MLSFRFPPIYYSVLSEEIRTVSPEAFGKASNHIYLYLYLLCELYWSASEEFFARKKILLRKILCEEKDAFFAKKNLRIYRSKI